MDEAQKQALFSAIRSVLVAVGGVVTAKGYADDALVQGVIGVVMMILPAIWGVWAGWKKEKA